MRSVRSFVVVLVLGVLAQAAWAAPAYFVQADMVRGAQGAMGAVCVPNSVFTLGESIVWRAYVYDGETGEQVSAEELEARGVTVTARVDGGPELEMAFSPHPPGAEDVAFYHVAAWQIPADHATGVFTWSVVVQDASGAEVVFEPIGQDIGLANLTLVPAS